MTKFQFYIIVAALFAIAGCYMIATVMAAFAIIVVLITWMGKLPKLPEGW